MANPYNIQTVLFKGVIFIPVAVFGKEDPTDTNYFFSRGATVSLSLANLLRAVLPLDAVSKAGGPCAGRLGHYNNAYPEWGALKDNTTNQVQSSPFEWWRWALMLMMPEDLGRLRLYPGFLSTMDMLFFLGGWQLFQHVRTEFLVEATMSTGEWSPVASLFVEDAYWSANTHKNNWMQSYNVGGTKFSVGTPLPGCTSYEHIQAGWTKVQQDAPDEMFPPGWPPAKADAGAAITKFEQGIYCQTCFPSFAMLFTLGAPLSFPPHQQPVGRRSFSKHTVKGIEDPQGRKWMTLWPKSSPTRLVAPGTPGALDQSEVETLIGQLFLAQAGNNCPVWTFGTHVDTANTTNIYGEKTMGTAWGAKGNMVNHWAVIKVTSKWRLGNHTRWWFWDNVWGGKLRTKWS